jgi:DNA-binding transcriptional ArsR family regulator
MDAVMRAIAEPRRQRILRLVWEQERPAGDVAAHFEISRPAVSKHLRILREAGLVEERQVGTRRLYRARQDRLAEVRAFLESFWDQSLDAVKDAAEMDARRRRGG